MAIRINLILRHSGSIHANWNENLLDYKHIGIKTTRTMKIELVYKNIAQAGIFSVLLILANILICCQSSEITDSRSSQKWLIEREGCSELAPKLVEFLKPLDGQIRLLHCKYDGSKLSKNTPFKSNSLEIDGNRWKS